MILKVEEIGLSLQVEEAFLQELVTTGKLYYPNEFGGFLVGYYSEDFRQLNITDTILPKTFKATKYRFERSNRGIGKKLKAFYNSIPSKIYVGEWHTHPDNSSNPSITDFVAINSIINNKATSISNPILLIIGYTAQTVDFGFYVSFKNKLYKYE